MAGSSIAGSEVPPNFVYDEDSKTLTVRHVDNIHVGNVDTVHVGDIHHHGSTSYKEVDANIEPINEAAAIEADPRILQRLQKVLSDYHNPEKWIHNRELCFELVSLFQQQGAALTKVRFDSVHFFVSVKLGPDHDAFLRACRDDILSRGLTKLLVTPELEEAAGVKLRVRLDVKETSTTINVSGSAPAGRMTDLMDRKLIEIGDALGDTRNLVALGLLLGFSRLEVDMFLATNRARVEVSSEGTNDMLFAWRRKTPGADQAKELRDALMASNLGHVAEKHL